MDNQPRAKSVLRSYPYLFYFPAGFLFVMFFLIPTAMSFYYSLTRWSLFDATFIGLSNYITFLQDPQLKLALRNTIIYAFLTSGFKVVIGLPLAMLLTSRIKLSALFRSLIYFPVLISTVAAGITFYALMQPSTGLINVTLKNFGAPRIDWLGDPAIALYSVVIVDIWKGVGIAMVLFMAGIQSIPLEYFDAARLEGGVWVKFRHVILPLSRNATFTVILLSFIGGLRTFDLIWAMTHGGPGFASDVLTSVIFKEYQAGFYGLSTAGNVIMFLLVTVIAYPMMRFFNRMELEL